MIICQCNIITEQRIEEAVVRLLKDDPWGIIVPNKVYHALGKSGRCCGCFPNVVRIIARTREDFHRRRNSENAEASLSPDRVNAENPAPEARRRRARRARSGRSAA
jgi:bacterioferritin-associated ferredoxin